MSCKHVAHIGNIWNVPILDRLIEGPCALKHVAHIRNAWSIPSADVVVKGTTIKRVWSVVFVELYRSLGWQTLEFLGKCKRIATKCYVAKWSNRKEAVTGFFFSTFLQIFAATPFLNRPEHCNDIDSRIQISVWNVLCITRGDLASRVVSPIDDNRASTPLNRKHYIEIIRRDFPSRDHHWKTWSVWFYITFFACKRAHAVSANICRSFDIAGIAMCPAVFETIGFTCILI